MEQPSTIYKEKKYYMVGCRKCDRIEQAWTLFSDGNKYLVRCTTCGHTEEINPKTLLDKPDNANAIDMRFF